MQIVQTSYDRWNGKTINLVHFWIPYSLHQKKTSTPNVYLATLHMSCSISIPNNNELYIKNVHCSYLNYVSIYKITISYDDCEAGHNS